MSEEVKRKLWFKKGVVSLNPVVENYNAGDDIMYDQELVPYDIQGSKAYAKLLQKTGIITADELEKLTSGLEEIMVLYNKGEFIITLEDEDCHTKIENFLVDKLGEAGKKIHTARSRNDQVLVTLRLFIREKLGKIREEALRCTENFIKAAQKYEFMPMPGYTHTQKAMPTTVGTWIASFAESLLDDIELLDKVIDLANQNPLGSGAGYGSPFPFDRDYLSELMGFRKTQNNVNYCHNSKGKIEAMVLEAGLQLMLTLNKFATDIIFFSSQEYQFFVFDDSISTGSSIMPQKKNLDVAELLRARVSTVAAAKQELVMNYINKVSGYHRDTQEVKRPLFLGLRYTKMSLEVAGIIIEKIKPREDILYKAMTPDLFATHKAFELVKNGRNFRDAYMEIGAKIKELTINKDEIVPILKQSTHQGGAGNLGLERLLDKVRKLKMSNN